VASNKANAKPGPRNNAMQQPINMIPAAIANEICTHKRFAKLRE